MNDKLKLLILLPALGMFILMIIYFIKYLLLEVDYKKFVKYFGICITFGAGIALIFNLTLFALYYLYGYESRLCNIFVNVVAGYIINVFSFIIIDKNHDDMMY